jgi:hypothetical protein
MRGKRVALDGQADNNSTIQLGQRTPPQQPKTDIALATVANLKARPGVSSGGDPGIVRKEMKYEGAAR